MTSNLSSAFLRIYHERQGGHVHLRVFVGKGSKSGDLVVTDKEWPELRRRLKRAGAQIKNEGEE